VGRELQEAGGWAFAFPHKSEHTKLTESKSQLHHFTQKRIEANFIML
jgi:hypothetical protein